MLADNQHTIVPQMARILVVDDDNEILNVIRTVAESAGHIVEVVNHGGRFMTAYVRTKPDIIVLDVVMPDVDGIELIRWLVDVGCTARIIITSGAHGGGYGEMAGSLARAAGVANVVTLPKPFHIRDLRSVLQ